MTGRYKKLFSPIDIGNLKFPNRIMRTSMVSGLSTEDGYVTDEVIARYQREAKGGVGSIVIEAAVIQPSRSNYNLRISDDTFMTNLNKLLSAIRDINSQVKIGIQLVHFLKISRSGWRQKVEDFTEDELSIVIRQHADAAIRAKSIGFDFIELHMAHAYTLSSFLSLSNMRKDEYGSSLEGRLKLPIEVYNAVRDEVGTKYAIGIRINGEDFTILGNTLLQTTRISHKFAELGINYISVSAGSRYEDALTPRLNTPPNPMSGYSGHRMSPSWWFPDGTHAYVSDNIRKYIHGHGFNTPIIIAGKIRTPKLADTLLENDNADIIGLCRAILCDPDWPIKARQGNDNQIVKCTACNWCLEADSRMEKVNCSRWPQNAILAPDPFLPELARSSALSNTMSDV